MVSFGSSKVSHFLEITTFYEKWRCHENTVNTISNSRSGPSESDHKSIKYVFKFGTSSKIVFYVKISGKLPNWFPKGPPK